MGDHQAFSALFTRHFGFVYNFVFRRTADWSVAEDIAGAVFLELWRQRRKVTPIGGSIRPWLAGVASNQVKKHWRKAGRRSAAYERAGAAAAAEAGSRHEDPAELVASRIDDEHQMQAILAALADLPGPQRDVLQLWAWEGFSHREIAAALDISETTVRTRLHRARARLHATGTPRGLRVSGPGTLSPAVTEPAPGIVSRGGQ
jgi:RNA polymerase sigma factor (sigma-70 family)